MSIRRAVIGLAILALTGDAGAGLLGPRRTARGDELSDVIAEIERSDPACRMDQLMARHAAHRLLPSRNAVVQAQRALKLLPTTWQSERSEANRPLDPTGIPRGTRLYEVISASQPGQPLAPNVSRGLRAELAELAGPLAEARKLADLPQGHVQHQIARDPVMTLLPYEQDSRRLARLLQMDVIRKAGDNDPEGAARSTLAILNLSRSIGEAPFSISQLVRMAEAAVAVQSLELALGRGRPSEPTSRRLQEAFTAEVAGQRLPPAARWERAIQLEAIRRLEAGEGAALMSPSQKLPADWFRQARYRHALAGQLRLYQQLVVLADQPRARLAVGSRDFSARIQALKKDVGDEVWRDLGLDRLASLTNYLEAEQRCVCRLSCTATALASLRYRGATGRWPVTLKDLVPAQQKESLLDPYSGEPLRLRRESSTLLFYGLGRDGRDDGGRLDPKGSPGHDVGFELVDPRGKT